MSKRPSLLKRLRRSRAGLSTVEMALGLSFLLTAGLGGVELANYGVATMRINQLATHMADNASRIGDTSMLASRKIYESDINDLLLGANLQAGKQIKFFDHGRAIISSLQVDSDDEQYIHWQRCMGIKNHPSSYGAVDDPLADGMGPVGREVIAFDSEAVMFVELSYDYQPIVSTAFVGTPVIRSVAAFTVRSDRDLSGIFQRDPTEPDPVADCATFNNAFAAGSGGGGGGGGGSSSGGSGGSSSSSSGGGGSSSSSSGGGGSGGASSGGKGKK
jgi:hypothetical protein